jgi:hypothetical protein
MQSKALNPEQYIDELPTDRKLVLQKLREIAVNNLPKGFKETMTYGMLGYVVPHETYPNGYHCDPKLPLGFVSMASQKNFVALYHMGIYCNPKLLDWFVTEYPKYCKTKLDMGKSCIRFKKMDDIPYDLIAQLLSKVSVEQWIEWYEKGLNRKNGN